MTFSSGTSRRQHGFTLVELPVVSKRKGAAFTLVELLVVIAIIGTLVALLLPAVQAARGSARTTQCASQIGELAKGMIAYQTSKENFPGFSQFVKRGQNVWATAKYPTPTGEPRIYVTWTNNRNEAVPFTWATMLLRNIERQDIWDQIVSSDVTIQPEIRSIDVFRCPADLEAGEIADRAALSYNANTGAWDRDSSGNFLVETGSIKRVGDTAENGVFFDLASLELAGKKGITTRLSGIRDGAATTILLSENRQKTYDPATPGAEPNFSWLYGNEQQIGMVWVVDLAPTPSLQEGINRNASDLVEFPSNRPQFARPASNHGSGVNVAFCDAHTKFLSDSIDYKVYQQLMTANGSKCVDPTGWDNSLSAGQPIYEFRRAAPLSESDYK